MTQPTAATAATTAALPEATRMGVVRLVARDPAALEAFYAGAVGLDVLERTATSTTLGAAGQALIVVDHDPHAAPEDPRSAGLFHTALVFDDPRHLSAALVGLAERAPASSIGASDHLVSRAFYARDPEGNELELYVDRPRDEWSWRSDRVVMANAPLDPRAFIVEHPPADGPLRGVSVGHVHLRVGDIAAARAFYVDGLGFAVTSDEWDSALFVAAGGYHHHLGFNVWRSAGAGTRPGGTTGLGSITIHVGAPAALAALADRLRAAEVAHTSADGVVVASDPWGLEVHVVV